MRTAILVHNTQVDSGVVRTVQNAPNFAHGKGVSLCTTKVF